MRGQVKQILKVFILSYNFRRLYCGHPVPRINPLGKKAANNRIVVTTVQTSLYIIYKLSFKQDRLGAGNTRSDGVPGLPGAAF